MAVSTYCYVMSSRQSGAENVALSIVEEIATVTGREPHELDPPLNDAIDPDALEALIRGDAVKHISFEYQGHLVEVDGDGSVSVVSTRRTK